MSLNLSNHLRLFRVNFIIRATLEETIRNVDCNVSKVKIMNK